MFLMHFRVNLWKQRLSSKGYQLVLWNIIKVSRIFRQQGRIDWVILFKIDYFWEKYKDDISFTTVKSSGVFNAYWSCCSLQCLPYMGWCQPKGKLWTSWLFSGVLSPLLLLPFIPTPKQGQARSVCSPLQVASYLKITTTSSRLVLFVCRTSFKFSQWTADGDSLLSLQHQRI